MKTLKDISDRVSDFHEIRRRPEVLYISELLIDCIIKTLESGEDIELGRLGSFSITEEEVCFNSPHPRMLPCVKFDADPEFLTRMRTKKKNQGDQ